MNATALVARPPRLQAGGTLNPRRHLYVERRQDQEVLDLLLEGQYVNILTSRQMGKSSLMVRAAEALSAKGVRTASLDLAAELGTPADASGYFLGLLTGIAHELGLSLDLGAWWQGPRQRDRQPAPDPVLSGHRGRADRGPGGRLSRRDRQHPEAALHRRPVHRASRHAQRACDRAGLRADHLLPDRGRRAQRADQGPADDLLQRRRGRSSCGTSTRTGTISAPWRRRSARIRQWAAPCSRACSTGPAAIPI